MVSSLDGNLTYFENRITEEFLASLLASGNSFFLENVANLDSTVELCKTKLTQLGLSCRIEDRRSSWVDDAAMFLPWPVKLCIAAWILTKDAARRLSRPRANVVIVKSPGALRIRFR